MAQEKDYRKKVYSALKGELGDSFSKSEDEFNSEMDSNPDYKSKVYSALKGELGDSFNKSEDEFYSLMSDGGGSVGKPEGSQEPLEQSGGTTTTSSSETPSPTSEQSTGGIDLDYFLSQAPAATATDSKQEQPKDIYDPEYIAQEEQKLSEGRKRAGEELNRVKQLEKEVAKNGSPYEKDLIGLREGVESEMKTLSDSVSNEYSNILEQRAMQLQGSFKNTQDSLQEQVNLGNMSVDEANKELGVEQEFLAKKAKENAKQYLPELEKKLKERQSEIEANYNETQKSLIEKQNIYEKQQYDKRIKEMGFFENLGYSLQNEWVKTKMMPIQVTQVASQLTPEDDESGFTLQIGGEDGIVSFNRKSPAERQVSNYKQLEELRKELKPTKQIIKSIKDEDYVGAASAAVGSTMNLVGSMVRAYITKGISMSGEIGEPMWVSAVKAKVEETGKTPEQIIVEDSEDELTSMTLGALAVVSERFGVKGAQNFIKSKVLKKEISNEIKKKAPTLIGTVIKEDATELFQGGIEKVNDKILKEGNSLYSKEGGAALINEMGKFLISEEGAETLVSTTVGSLLMLGGSKGAVAAYNNIATPSVDVSTLTINDIIDDSEGAREGIDKLFKAGKITEEGYANATGLINNIESYNESLSDDNTNKAESIKLFFLRDKKKAEMEKLDESQRVGIQEEIDGINERLKEIATPKEANETESKQQPTDSDGARQDNEQEVESLRQKEQEELLEQIPNAENYLTDGKVDKEKITNPEDIAKFEEIYNRYDEAISPLLKPTQQKGKEEEVTVYSGTSSGNKSNKDGVSYVTKNRAYASFYDGGSEKPSNTALDELSELKEPTKPIFEPIDRQDDLANAQNLGYDFKSIQELDDRISELNNLVENNSASVLEKNEAMDLASTGQTKAEYSQILNKYNKELSEYKRKKKELEDKANDYLSPRKLSGKSKSLDVTFGKDSKESIFNKLKALGIAKVFKGGDFLDNYHSDLVEYAKNNNIDYYDGITGGVAGSMNTAPDEIIVINQGALKRKGKGVEGEVKLNSLPKSQRDKGLGVLNNIKDENKELTLNELADVYEAMGIQDSDIDSEFAANKGLTAKGLKDILTSQKTKKTPVTEEQKTQIAENIGKVRKTKPKNIKGLIDVMKGVFGLDKNKSESAAVVGDIMVDNMAKRAGISKDEMYQKIAYAKAEKAPNGSLKQEGNNLIWKSTAKEGLGKINQKNATPEQWVKTITEKGGKGTAQELEWIGLSDFLNNWKKENNAKSVPKEVVEQYIADNQIEIVEVTKTNKKDIEGRNEIRSQVAWILIGKGESVYNSEGNLVDEDSFYSTEKFYSEINKGAVSGSPKYSDYTLEGGENYREVLLALPSRETVTFEDWLQKEYGDVSDFTENQLRLAKGQYDNAKEGLRRGTEKGYKSSHWDESNILAHVRMNERTMPNGERVLFIEEVQSDWAQEGKKDGFLTNEQKKIGKKYAADAIIYAELVDKKKKEGEKLNRNKEFKDAANTMEGSGIVSWTGIEAFGKENTVFTKGNETPKSQSDLIDYKDLPKEYRDANEKRREIVNASEYSGILEQIDSLESEYGTTLNAYGEDILKQPKEIENAGSVEDMPYKKTDQWVAMAMRRVMQMASNEGFDRVAWVTGEQSAERYNLSHQVDEIGAVKNKNGTYNIHGTKDGDIVTSKNDVKESELEGLLGKDLANNIIEENNKETNFPKMSFKGQDLKVGGEGMKAFYNSILPSQAKKEARRFDKKAKVEVVDFSGEGEVYNELESFINNPEKSRKEGETDNQLRQRVNIAMIDLEIIEEQNELRDKGVSKNTNKQLSIAITPEMRMNLNGAVPLFQSAQGAMTAADGNYVVYALTNPNVSTPLHELAHVYEHYLNDAERKQIERWSGHKSGTVEFSEAFARGFERFLANGKVSNPRLQSIFENFKAWLTEIYNGIKGSDIDIELNSEMQSIYDTMLSEETTGKSGTKTEEVDLKSAFDKGADSALDWIAQQKKDLKKFGNETMGINLPIAVAQTALTAAEVAIKAGKTINQAISAAKKAVVDSDWYQGLSEREEAESIVAVNALFGRKTKIPSRTVESETEGLTDKEVAKQGVTELVDAMKAKSKEKLAAVANKFKQKINEQKQKAKDFKERRTTVTNFAKELAKEINKAGVKYMPTKKINTILSAIESAKTDKSLDTAINKLIKTFNDIAVTDEQVKEKKKYADLSKQFKKNAKKFGDNKKAVQLSKIKEIPEELEGAYRKLIENLGVKKSSIKQDTELIDEFYDKYVKYTESQKQQALVDEGDLELTDKQKAELKDKSDAKESEEKDRVEASSRDLAIETSKIHTGAYNNVNKYFKDKIYELSKVPRAFIKENFSGAFIENAITELQNAQNGIMSGRAIQQITDRYDAKLNEDEMLSKSKILGKASEEIDGNTKEFLDKNTKRKDFYSKKLETKIAAYIDDLVKSVKGTPVYNLLNIYFSKKSLADKKMNNEKKEHIDLLKGAVRSRVGKFKDLFTSTISEEFRLNTLLFFYETHLQNINNPLSNKTPSVKQFVDRILEEAKGGKKDIKLRNSEEIAEIENLFNEFKNKDGELDFDKLNDYFNSAERKLIDWRRNYINEHSDMFEYINVAYRDNPLDIINSFSPRTSQAETEGKADVIEDAKANLLGRNKSMKSHSANNRVSGVPISSFDAVNPFNRYIEEINRDFYLTPALRRLDYTVKGLLENGNFATKQFALALQGYINENVAESFSRPTSRSKSNLGTRVGIKFINNVKKAMLLSGIRAVIDFGTNSAFIGMFKAGVLMKAKGLGTGIIGELQGDFGTTQISRTGAMKADITLSETDGTSEFGRMKPIGERASKKFEKILTANVFNRFSEWAIKEQYKFADLVVKPLWLGQFNIRFKKITGKEFSVEEYRSNPNYKLDNKKAIERSIADADRLSTNLLNTGEIAESRLEQQKRMNTGEGVVKDFMQGFSYNENEVLMQSWKSAFGKGNVSRSEAITTLLAVSARAVVYQVFQAMAIDVILNMVLGDDFDEEDEDKFVSESKKGVFTLIALNLIGGKNNLYKMAAGVATNFAYRMYLKSKGEEYDRFKDALIYAPDVIDGKLTDAVLSGLGGAGVGAKDIGKAIKSTTKLATKMSNGEELTVEDLVEARIIEAYYKAFADVNGLPFKKEMTLMQKLLDKKYGIERPWDKKESSSKLLPKLTTPKTPTTPKFN